MVAPVLASLAATAVVWTGCAHRPSVRPAEIVVACADANFYVERLRWRRWTATDAVATGVAHRNDCKPYCAAGHFHSFSLTIRLSRVVECVSGRREFSRITWKGGSETFPCSFLKLRT
jgi:hypothetical protein